MVRIVIKATAVFLVAFFLLAAVHELVPGLCMPRNANGALACPFCKLIYTLVIVLGFFSILWVTQALHMARRPVVFLVDRAEHRGNLLFRGPPCIPSSLCA